MSTGNKIAAFYVTDKGRLLAERIRNLYPGVKVIKFSTSAVKGAWDEYKSFIFIMAVGIVVRTVAPLIKDKKSDPAVIVLDENGKYAISLLSGHLGGANERAGEIADFLGGEAVITTASNVNGLTSIDLWARDNDLVIEDWKLLPHIGTRLINKGVLNVYADVEVTLPGEFLNVTDPASADLIITHMKSLSAREGFYLRPKNLVVGIGCNRGTSAEEIEAAVRKALDEHNLSFLSVRSVATIHIKADEPGIRMFCERYSFDVLSFRPEELNGVAGVARSEAAFRATGAKAVAEPSALLATGAEKLLIPKQKIGNVTVAAAEIKKGVREVEKKELRTPGKIYVVGTGPGNVAHITPYAQKAIRESDIIVGYGIYVELIRDLVKDKEVFSTGMTQEIDRCKKAVELSLRGKTVSVISGGDPGIYAMAGLVFELLRQQNGDAPLPAVEVIPGISALNACAAKLGAPLMHDFASISLSDRLTPWDLIEKRLDAAAVADFVIVLYNPKSKGRTEQISKAREIILRHRDPATPVGIVKGAMREKEVIIITDLRSMLDHEIDMQTTVVIGNSNTLVWNNVMITPRGYEKKKQYKQ
ncbi:MAG: precorrin-3B C(17)-methyltransferase [Nitrospirae bacterium]|nr:precorrin-3B C(17)-methyltransferase [Nitrospirota bacterium]MCL5423074.1 precorrin-3B C(17)-methyltransferase [Nitrospirota bacterium]